MSHNLQPTGPGYGANPHHRRHLDLNPINRYSSQRISSTNQIPQITNKDILGNNSQPNSHYPSSFTDPAGSGHPELNIPQPPQQHLVEREHFISFDSRDRDRNLYPNSNDYVLYIKGSDTRNAAIVDSEYKNIKSIRLVSAVYPNNNNILNEMYVLLEVKEIEGFYDSTNKTTACSFAKLYPDSINGPFIRAKTTGIEFLGIEYRPGNYKASWDRISVRIKKHDGTLFDFGPDSPPEFPPDPLVNHTLTFKVITMEPNTAVLGRHNV